MNIIDKGIKKGFIKFDEDKKCITYIHQDKRRNYTNPEEQIQAEAFVKLVLSYGYPVERIKKFVTVKMVLLQKKLILLFTTMTNAQNLILL